MDDRAIDGIFLGSLDNLPPVSSKIVRIFTSSTFTDMSMERNALMEGVYPRIKDYCREKHGLEFQVVDMRWGVRDEATDDHMTTDLCMREIENCQRLSMGPNFVTFLGQKYGYRPIPTIIDGREFRMIRDTLGLMLLDTVLLDRWYREDTNAVPSVFVLQPISTILVNFNNKRAPKLQAVDQATWWDTLEKLQKLLRKAANALYIAGKIDHDAMHNYMMSVTEREVINGILNVSNTRNHCLAYVRQINAVDMTNLREVSKFIDTLGRTVDIEAQKLLTDLRDVRLPAKIEASNCAKYTINWTGKEGLAVKYHEEYLKEFTAHFYKHIIKLVDRAMRKEDLSSLGHIVTEILQHLQAGKSSVTTFQGREEELKKIDDYFTSDSAQPFVLHGKGGSGKTSLLAKAASICCQICHKGSKPMLILRFLGTTPDSSSVIPMLTSVCKQIMYNYMMPWEGIPDDLIPLIAFTKRMLTKITTEQPLYICLDSVDQLTGPSAGKLTWLPTKLPPNVKIIISTASEGDAKEYNLLRKMLSNENQFVEVHPLGEDLAEYTIKCWLETNGRDLNKYQWNIVKKAISECTLPIFIKLIFAEVMRWRSYSRASDTILAYTVMDSIMKLFDRIEKQHGRQLVAHALSYITASKSGLSETEIEDLISLDDIVLDDVFQYHMPPVRRIPPLLWTRIRRDLPNYLSEREADGVSVLNWYHRQFRDAAIERYFVKPELVIYFHSSIAEYFLGTWGGGRPKPFKYTEIQRYRFGLKNAEGTADRKVPLQPLVFFTNDGRVSGYNKRKFGELPFHLIRSERFEDLFENVLFNYMWLHSKVSSCPLQAILADFEDVVEFLTDSELIKQLNIVADGMRLGGVVLAQHPDMLASQITGRLLPVKDIYPRVRGLIAQCDKQGIQHCALVPAFHILHTPGGPLKYSLEGHTFGIFGFCLTSDQRFVLTVSNKFLMFDLMTGEITCDVNPDIPGIMQTLSLSPDDKYALSYTNHNQVIILNSLSGDVEIYRNMLETRPVCGTAISNDIGIAWSPTEWVTFALSNGVKQSVHTLNESGYLISHIHYIDEDNYHIALTTYRKGKENLKDHHLFKSMLQGNQVEDLIIDSALYIQEDSNNIYITQKNGNDYETCSYSLTTDGWHCNKVLGSLSTRLMALEISPEDEILVGTAQTGFYVWILKDDRMMELLLPNNVKNISTKPFQSQSSLALTKHSQYAVGGVRKSLYIWNLKDGQLLKEVDAHIARINRIRSLIIDDFNGIVSSSIDKTLKVWNVKNIFEKVYVIDRMEMAIDCVSLSADGQLAVTATRSSVGVWNVQTGKLYGKLVDAPVGAIVTHAIITADGKYVISTESGNFLIWNLQKGCVISREQHANVKQLLLGMEDKIIIIITLESGQEARCTSRIVPTGDKNYSFTFPCDVLLPAVITKNNLYLGLISMEANQKVLLVHSCRKGSSLFKISLENMSMLGSSAIIPFPGKASAVVIISNETSWIVDIESKRIVKGIKRWNGACTDDGRYGLVSPNQGGLEVIEIKSGQTVKVLIPPISEGVFAVTAKFNKTNDYVLYYHSGRVTIRLFRLSDGKMIGNYKLAAEASDFNTTQDGLSVVVGGVDGSFVVLAITDPENKSAKDKLQQLPSRCDANIRAMKTSVSFKTMSKVTATAAYVKRQSACEESQDSKVCVIS